MEMVFLSYVDELCIYPRLCLSSSWFCLRLRTYKGSTNQYVLLIHYSPTLSYIIYVSITMNKASGGVGIPVELFQILKDDAVKVPANLEYSAVTTGLEKVGFHFNLKERQCQRMLRLPPNCTHLTR